MSKKKIIDAVQASYPNLTKKQVGTLIDATFNTISDELQATGNKFSYPSFGTFTVKERAARTGINPATKAKIQISASATVGFKPATSLKAEIN